ncbi:VRR-NUC domain-containing protein [Syncephalis fuscata]|nr:VRR-NUC domain-containing protein [Syncephalis fuscata]
MKDELALDRGSDSDLLFFKTQKRSGEVEDGRSPDDQLQKRPRTADQSAYIQVVQNSLEIVLGQESFLFEQDELNLFSIYRQLAVSAQLLFVRLYARKHKWIRVSSIEYDEINNVAQVLVQLKAAQLIDQHDAAERIQELLYTLTSEELRCLGRVRSTSQRLSKKDELIEHIVDQARTQRRLMFQRNTDQQPSCLAIDKNSGLNTLLAQVLKITGGVVRLSNMALNAFNRLHTVRYRCVQIDSSTMLSATLLAAFGLRRYPAYTVKRSCKVFPNRSALLAYEAAVAVEHKLHELIADNSSESIEHAWLLCQENEAVWDLTLVEAMESNAYDKNNYFLARFTAGWVYTKIMEHGSELLGRLKRYQDEAVLLQKLLNQHSFRLGTRGSWYERLALVQERYLKDKRAALAICIKGIEDPNVWMAKLQSLQQRILRLQKSINLPIEERRCFDHIQVKQTPQIFIEGVRANQKGPGAKAKYVLTDGSEGTVEELALEYYTMNGYQGVHSETSILTTLFALLFWDILFSKHEGAFETPEQSAPLDLTTDAFYIGRRDKIEKRLEQLAMPNISTNDSTFYLKQLEKIDDAERAQLTVCRGVSWEYCKEDLMDIAQCLGGRALSAICRVLAQEYGKRASGAPDLCLWKKNERICKFVEVKGPGDRLSETQKIWCNVFIQHNIDIEVCHVRLSK